MAPCPKCAHDNDDVDFCANCGTYLRWDPTRAQPAVKVPEPAAPPAPEAPAVAEPPAATGDGAAAAAAAPAPPAAPPGVPPPEQQHAVSIPVPVMRTMDMPVIRAGDPNAPNIPGVAPLLTTEAVQITLNYPELPGNEQKLVVEAGGHVPLPALVRNQSGIVDNYELQVKGMPEEWWNVTPPSVYLVPFGAPSGTYEQDVHINFNPPRSAEAEARIWEIEVIALSRAQNEVTGRTVGRVEITPYEQIESELRPEIVTGRRRGEYAVMVKNRANAPLDTEVTGVDSQNALKFGFAKSRFVAEPGRRDGTTFTVKPKHQHWIGRTIDRRFEVTAKGAVGESTARPLQGTFRQKPWIPFWVPIVIPALVAGAVLLYSLIPHKSKVPDLHGMTIAAAGLAIQKANLKAPSQPPAEVPSKTVAYLHVVRQSPSWHKGPVQNGHFTANKVKTGTTVQFFVAEPRVPNLVGATQAEAQKVLPVLKLQLGPAKTELASRAKAKIGAIVSQSPAPKTPVAEGTKITIVVAVGSGLRTVPNVVGQGIAQASALIKGAGLTPVLNPIPSSVNPTTAKISLQVPTAQSREKAGSAVTIYVNPPPPPKTTTAATTTTPQISASALAGASAAAAAAQVKAAGGTAVVTKQFSASAPGTVVGTNPADVSKIQKGQTVQLIVSDGEPPLAFSDGSSIYVTSAVNGSGTKKIASSGDTEDEPSWQPNGHLVAFRRSPSGAANAGKIWMVDTSKGATSTRAMTSGPNDRRPAFSPDGKVIAFIRKSSTGTDGDLCFVRAASTLRQGACIKDPAFDVDRPAWSPDGRAILVVAHDPKDTNQIELGEYTTARPFSSSPSDWVWQGLITDKMHGSKGADAVIYAAFSPDGTQVALVANWTNNQVFQLYTASWSNGQLGTPKAVTPTVRACEVSWRADGGEVIVTQADNSCTNALGALARLELTSAATVTQLRASGAQNPSWQYVTPP
jgi:beta-lactam-binding protein with PASTA domain